MGIDRRDVVGEQGRCRVMIGRPYPGGVRRRLICTPGRFDTTALQRQLSLPQSGCRLLYLLFRFLLHPMHVPHRGRAPVPTSAGMEVLELVEIFAGDAGAFGQQGGEFVGGGRGRSRPVSAAPHGG